MEDRFGVLVERRLAGLIILAETEELSGLLETTEGARTQYLGAVELHVDLGSDLVSERSPNVAKEMDAMARIALNCKCGWNFFVPGTTTGLEVTCPSCSQDVRIPGRKPGRDVVMSPGEIAARQQGRQQILRMMIGAAAALLIAGVAFAAWSPLHSHPASAPKPPRPADSPGPDSQELERKRKEEEERERKRKILDPIPNKSDSSSPSPSHPALTPEQIEDHRSSNLERVWMINMSAVVSEILRLRNMTEPYEKLQADIARYEGEIRHSLAELQKAGQVQSLSEYFAKGDKLTGLSGANLRTMKAGEAAQFLQNWTIDRRPGSTIDFMTVLHDGKDRTITLMFPQDPPGLLLLLHHPGLEAEKLSNGRASDRVLLPSDLIASYQSQVDALLRGYLSWIPTADAQRVRDLLARKMGSSDEIEWFQKRVLDEILDAFRRENEGIRRKLGELEPQMKDNPAPDAVYLKEGRRLDGKVSEEGADKVRVKFRSGSRLLSNEEVERIVLGKGVGTEIQARFQAAKGNLEMLMSLLAWCSDKNLAIEKQCAACQILLIDPTVEKARSTLGLPRRTVLGSR